MMVYAWNRKPPPPPRVFVRLECGGFEFPRDVQLELVWGEGGRALFRGLQASFPRPEGARLEARLLVRRPGGETAVPVGPGRTIELPAGDATGPIPFPVSPADCRTALQELRAAR